MSLMNALFGVSVRDGMANVVDQLRRNIVQPVLADVCAQTEVPGQFAWLPVIWQANVAGAVAPEEHELINEILSHYDGVLSDEQMAQAFGLAVRDAKMEAIREGSSNPNHDAKHIAFRAREFQVAARSAWMNARRSIKDPSDTSEVDQALNNAEYDMLSDVWKSKGQPEGDAWTNIILAAVWAFSEVREQEFAKAMLRSSVSHQHDVQPKPLAHLDAEVAALTAHTAELDRRWDSSVKELEQTGRQVQGVVSATDGLKLRRR